MEREYLTEVVERLVPSRDRYLDFACGTGRVIGFLYSEFGTSQGVDISESMLDIARKKNIDAEFIEGDITQNADIVGGDYDLVTAFRFFLNAQDSLRLTVMKALAGKLSKDGVLVFNVHNSRPSLLWLQNRITDIFLGRKKASMSRDQVVSFVGQAGLRVLETKALGFIPKWTCKVLRPKLWRFLDTLLSRVWLLKECGSHVIYVCKHQESNSQDSQTSEPTGLDKD
jgi:predicted TPR repeat methyltransferase